MESRVPSRFHICKDSPAPFSPLPGLGGKRIHWRTGPIGFLFSCLKTCGDFWNNNRIFCKRRVVLYLSDLNKQQTCVTVILVYDMRALIDISKLDGDVMFERQWKIIYIYCQKSQTSVDFSSRY